MNKNLDKVRGRILAIKPLPNTREVASEVYREESSKKVMMDSNHSTVEGSASIGRGLSYPTNQRKEDCGATIVGNLVTPRIYAGKLTGNLPIGSHLDLNPREKVVAITLPPGHQLQAVPSAKEQVEALQSCSSSRCQTPQPLSWICGTKG